jgi:eukaryotic-like serine/threonine-protein kinase
MPGAISESTCTQCGRDIPTDAGFCPACGTPVPPSRPAGATDAATVNSPGPLTFAPGPGSATISPTGIRTSLGDALRPGEAGFRAGDQVGPRYTIIRLLGAGGMGAVYQAFDHELGVGVAIKVIRPAAQSDATAARDLEQRFKRELVLARQITHKHVVRIHDIGDVDGIKYLTMPFVEGHTLADMLRRDGKLAVPRALLVAKQVALGLLAAHDKGVIHRDLKPENIMIEKGEPPEGGDALIMDFGIARSVQRGATQTAAGSVIGTLEYMAPEQARGQPVDQRADIYSFGLILYDVLVGRQRLANADPMSEMLGRLAQAPPPPRTLEASVPEALDRIVQKCLEPNADARFQTMTEVVAALDGLTAEGHARAGTAPQPVVKPRPRWQLAAVAVLVAAAGIGGWLISNQSVPATPAGPQAPISVLVAQFQNNTGDAVFNGVLEQALTLGLEGATFITAYPQRDALRSAAAIKPGATLDESTARLVAVRDGVALVMLGSVGGSGGGYTISVRAIDATDGKEVAAASRTVSEKSGVLAAVGDMAARIRRELGDTAADPAGAGRETFTSASLEAASAYVAAQELAASGKFGEAISKYQEAVQRDSNFGRAYSGWANAAFRAGRSDEADQMWKKSLTLLERMNEREKYRTLGGYYLGPGANDEQAVENYRMLVDKYPSDGPGLNNLAVAYFRVLDFKRAFEQGQKATEVYPKSVNYRTNLALYAMYASDFAAGAAEAKRVLEISDFDKAHLPIAMAALQAGNFDGAIAEYDLMAKSSTRGASIASMGRADVAIYQGRFADAATELRAGAAADEAGNLQLPRALKLIALAEVAAATDSKEALSLATQAMELSSTEAVVVPAARLFVAAGRTDDARKIAAGLEKQIRKRSRALAGLIHAEIALAAKKPVEAIDALSAARGLADLWLVRFTLGRAYVEQGRHADAIAELEACRQRAGEATDVFLDDWPSFRYTVPLKYWLGRAQEGLGIKDSAAANYQAYIDLRSQVPRDALAADARKRISR